MPRDSYAGIPASEVIAFAELMNELELQHVEMFGDSINSAIVTNVKAADLKQQPVSVRGLARVIGLQPSTIRRRIGQLVEKVPDLGGLLNVTGNMRILSGYLFRSINN